MSEHLRPKSRSRLPYSVLVVGLAREGTALARFLVERGARVTVTDIKPVEALGENVIALAGLPIRYVLGGHPLSLLEEVDIVFVSPGVPLEIPLLVQARQRNLPLSSETRLFTRLCPAPIVGITGSSGKTTTTAIVGEMLRSAGCRTWVGGNIGRPLIAHLDELSTADRVVMELSSFQLEFSVAWPEGESRGMLFDPAGWSPPVAAVLNVTPNHLDRHPTMEAYTEAKAHILRYQGPDDVAVLNLDNPVTRRMGSQAQSDREVFWFSLEQEVREGAFLRGDELILRQARHEERICCLDELRLLGRHNVANVLAACALATATGVPVECMRQVATSFEGVAHRLECVRERDGVRWYNDSIATSPERTIAALQAFQEPLVLLSGGRDKHLPWDELADLAWTRVRHLILFGEAAELIEDAMVTARLRHSVGERDSRAAKPSAPDEGQATPQTMHMHQAGTLERAVQLAAQVAQPGDVVLLAPGGTSFDAYPDFVARGEHFRQLVEALE
jgi:UDP-N-acetylmuramoylalanine--D-glutamate ligase